MYIVYIYMDHWAMIYLWSSGAPKTRAVAPWARGEDEEDGGFGGIGGFAADLQASLEWTSRRSGWFLDK